VKFKYSTEQLHKSLIDMITVDVVTSRSICSSLQRFVSCRQLGVTC